MTRGPQKKSNSCYALYKNDAKTDDISRKNFSLHPTREKKKRKKKRKKGACNKKKKKTGFLSRGGGEKSACIAEAI